MNTATQVTVQEFLANPDIHYYDSHELHSGEVVVVSPPSEAHLALQERIERLLQRVLSDNGFAVLREYYYTLSSNSRRADVAAVLRSRRDPANRQPFRGGPDLVVEILSPTNTAMDLDRLRAECFAEGTREFWQINQELKTVTVFRRRNAVAVFTDDDQVIALDVSPGVEIPVSSIFR